MEIYYDSLQEGRWFKGLHPKLKDATLLPISDVVAGTPVAETLKYDRPDIILADKGKPILVIERTVEVPTGHNVGQRFARLAAAAESKIPLVYFGPYMAKKHGGATAGPRYMNLRLFYALDVLADINGTAVTTINWPVDGKCELLKVPKKDARMKTYLKLFLTAYAKRGAKGINCTISESDFQAEQLQERKDFIDQHVSNPGQYDSPPPSVRIMSVTDFATEFNFPAKKLGSFRGVVLYDVGMTYVRSDPYTGTAMLYLNLYVLGEKSKKRALILNFPHITKTIWKVAAKSGRRKDVRLFNHISDVIVLKKSFLVL